MAAACCASARRARAIAESNCRFARFNAFMLVLAAGLFRSMVAGSFGPA